MSEEQGRTVRVKRLQIGTRVSGAIGEFIENDASDTKKRRKRQRVVGTIVEAVDHNRYRLKIDGSDKIIEASSCQLRVESAISTVLPDMPVVTGNRQEIADEIEIENQEAEEHLPQMDPEAENQEEEEDLLMHLGMDDDSDEDEPTQDPIASDEVAVAMTPYETMKQRALDHVTSLVGKKVVERKKKTKEEIEWTVIPGHFPSLPISADRSGLGIRGLEENKLHYNKTDPLVIAKSFLHLMFIDYATSFATMNSNLSKERMSNVKAFSDEETLVGLSLLIGKS